MENDWQLYRTRFLVKAKQLTRRMTFVDTLGREHCGNKGDYLVESCDGARRIASREIFEDVYVIMGTSSGQEPLMTELTARTIGLPVGDMRKHVVENRRPSQAPRGLIA
jgi:hypothetical protein